MQCEHRENYLKNYTVQPHGKIKKQATNLVFIFACFPVEVNDFHSF